MGANCADHRLGVPGGKTELREGGNCERAKFLAGECLEKGGL